MDLQTYFEGAQGLAVLSTANGDGDVNSAVYSRPHVLEEGKVAFVMNDKRSFKNLQTNPKASFLFVEAGEGYKGVRLYLNMVASTDEKDVVDKYRRHHCTGKGSDCVKYFVSFEVVESRQLLGDGEA